MEYDIYLTEKSGGLEMRIPWLPEKIAFQSGGTRFASYDILDLGQVQQVNGATIRKYKWSATLPGEGHKDLPFLRGSWQDPRKYQEVWSRWQSTGEPLRLLIPNTPINHDVQLADYSVDYAGAFGDYQYTVTFSDYRQVRVASTSPSAGTAAPEASRPAAPQQKTYTIRDGDTLWGIAARADVFGSGAQWEKLYQANKKVLDDEAARRGLGQGMGSRWIFSGTVLVIPGQGGGA